MRPHPSEAELQQFALENFNSEITVVEHISACEQCKATVEIYQELVLSIGQQQKPSFDFNLAQLVLNQIPSFRKSDSKDNIIFCIIAFVVTGLSGIICFWFSEIFAGLVSFSNLFMYLLVATAMIILIFQGFEIYKRYEHKINALDLY